VSEAGEIELVRTVEVAPTAAEFAEGTVVRGMFPSEPRGRALIRSAAPATQAMVVAASGFVAGAAVVGLAARRRGKGSRVRGKSVGARRTRKRGGAGELVRIVGTRSLLVDVHLLDGDR
jgi:hypothetical protein